LRKNKVYLKRGQREKGVGCWEFLCTSTKKVKGLKRRKKTLQPKRLPKKGGGGKALAMAESKKARGFDMRTVGV